MGAARLTDRSTLAPVLRDGALSDLSCLTFPSRSAATFLLWSRSDLCQAGGQDTSAAFRLSPPADKELGLAPPRGQQHHAAAFPRRALAFQPGGIRLFAYERVGSRSREEQPL